MATYIKKGIGAGEIAQADAKVRATVEGILSDIEARGDRAIRELSRKFDNWDPQTFRLSDAEIEASISKVSKGDLDDIRFAQSQVRRFAETQKDCLEDLEDQNE